MKIIDETESQEKPNKQTNKTKQNKETKEQGILTLNLQWKNKLTVSSLSLMYSFQVPIIKISHLKHFTNQPMQAFF